MLFESWEASGGSGRGGGRPQQSAMNNRRSIDDDDDDDDYSDEDERGGGENNHRGSVAAGGPRSGFDGEDEDGDIPMFHVERMDWRPTRDQGAIRSMAVGSNVLHIACSNGSVVRWNVETDQLEEISISRRSEQIIHKLFVDPTGTHCLVSMHNGQVYYIHGKKNKAVACQKIKGMVIESVAWNSAEGDEVSTRKILLGDSKGFLWETYIEAEKDRYCKRLYDLTEDGREVPISGLHIEMFPSSSPDPNSIKYFVMAATPTRHYQFIGGPTFEAMFARYASVPAFVELPGDLGYSELAFFSRYQSRNKASNSETMAWLTGAGMYYGNLGFGSQEAGDKVVDDGKLLAYPAYAQDSYQGEDGRRVDVPPLSLSLTEFHFLLLNQKRLVAINRLSEEVVYQDNFEQGQYGRMLGLCPDPRKDTVWMYSDRFVFEVEIESEDREVWKLYLDEGKFSQALDYCDTEYQREQVNNAQADHHFQQGAYELAATIYAKTQRSFEEVTLKFVNHDSKKSSAGMATGQLSGALARQGADVRNALKTYLQSKLDHLQPQDLTQQTMICTWLTEIYLDNLNNLSRKGDKGSPYPSNDPLDGLSAAERDQMLQAEVRDFQEFLDSYSDCLNRETTFELISSHGRSEELLYYAGIIQDLEWVLNHHLQNHNYPAALKMLAEHDQPKKIAELYYRFAPTLMQHLPAASVEMFEQLCARKRLDPVKLIPALMRYEATTKERNPVYAVKFLDACVKQGNTDPAIHNYLVSLYAKQEDELPLIKFIAAFTHNPSNPPSYDYKYALRLCHQQSKTRACVAIYTAMDLYEEAVKLALDVDLELAKKVVSVSERTADEQERKRLWLIIGRHVIQGRNGTGAGGQADIGMAMDILKESQLKLEDILPYFPDFVQIGEFKSEICKSLEAYNGGIESLKQKMEDYTESANLIRKDINELRNRSGLVTANQRCDLCTQPVLTRQFFLFPCTHVFHVDCITNEVTNYLEKNHQLRDEVVEAAQQDGHEEPGIRRARERKLIEQFAASECVFCGMLMIEQVQEPFIQLLAEDSEVASWEI